MYRIILVDDEKVVREGISQTIDWESNGYELVGVAENGIQALELINETKPHIVITDIRMPGLDGIELIRCVRQQGLEVEFVIISGHDEFDYAHQAMRFGVQHYLLKPCDEEEILSALSLIAADLEMKRQKEALYGETLERLQKAAPQVGEQFFNNMLMGAGPDQAEMDFVLSLMNLSFHEFLLLLLKVEGQVAPIERYALRENVQQVLGAGRVAFSTVRDEVVLVLVDGSMEAGISPYLEQMRCNCLKVCGKELTIAVGKKTNLDGLAIQYQQLKEAVRQSFYFGAGSILSPEEAAQTVQKAELSYLMAFEEIAELVKAGNTQAAVERLEASKNDMINAKQDIVLTKAFCMELMLMISRQAPSSTIEGYLSVASELTELNTLTEIFDLICKNATEIAQKNYRRTTRKHEQLIRCVEQLIAQNLDNPALSLKWTAREQLFMDEDYLGKLFYKHMRKRFTQYILDMRVEKAKNLLSGAKDYRIYEVTEQVGFENNTAYFSQVFKKATGYTPSEYKSLFRPV